MPSKATGRPYSESSLATYDGRATNHDETIKKEHKVMTA